MNALCLLMQKPEGKDVAYLLKNDDAVVLLLLVCFFVSALVFAKSKDYLLQRLSDFFTTRDRTNLFPSGAQSEAKNVFFLVIQFCVLAAFLLLVCVGERAKGEVSHTLWVQLFVAYVLVWALFLFLKWCLCLFLGWVFAFGEKVHIWTRSYTTLTYFLGLCLLPLAVAKVYVEVPTHWIVTTCLVLFIVFHLLLFYKMWQLFYKKNCGLLIILYFCTLEIMPWYLVYLAIFEINTFVGLNF